MYRWISVPMIALCLLSGCGRQAEKQDYRLAYREMAGCTMEAVVCCQQEGDLWEATLRCDYAPEGPIAVEVLAPELLAGVRAVVEGETFQLEYEDLCLDAGPVSRQQLSPALCLPILMDALREGWLVEENFEDWKDTPCLRLTVDQAGEAGGKLYSTVWLREEDGSPLRGEIEVDGEIVLTAEFTEFTFCDKINNPTTNEEHKQKVT